MFKTAPIPSFLRKRESMLQRLISPTISTDIQVGRASPMVSAPGAWAFLKAG